ncbi:MAG TPA: TetR/AcrR family transcriptional regulator [Lentimicrobium sp.]|nr:TetR/AcrR family transcriptional regulator [Lentimicrobium sp.]
MQSDDTITKHPKSKRYEVLMATAREVFWKYGFRRVSIEEICERAGISKMTFYRFFPNKLELAKAVFNKEIDHGLVAFRKLLFSSDHTTEEKVKGLLLMKAEGTHEISHEFLQDFYNSADLGLKEHIDKKIHEAWASAVDDFKRAQKEGIFRKDFQPELFFHLAESVMTILSNKALINSYENPQKLILGIADLMMFGIVQK